MNQNPLARLRVAQFTSPTASGKPLGGLSRPCGFFGCAVGVRQRFNSVDVIGEQSRLGATLIDVIGGILKSTEDGTFNAVANPGKERVEHFRYSQGKANRFLVGGLKDAVDSVWRDISNRVISAQLLVKVVDEFAKRGHVGLKAFRPHPQFRLGFSPAVVLATAFHVPGNTGQFGGIAYLLGRNLESKMHGQFAGGLFEVRATILENVVMGLQGFHQFVMLFMVQAVNRSSHVFSPKVKVSGTSPGYRFANTPTATAIQHRADRPSNAACSRSP